MRLFLVGMMGSGKTTVGKLVAERLGVPFRDLDEDIVARAGKSIARIFAEDGEEKFREIEHEVLFGLPEVEDRGGLPGEVVATGGGVVLREANRIRLRLRGSEVVWLDAKVHTLAGRLSATDRPLLGGATGDALIARLARIRDERWGLYELVAPHPLWTDTFSPAAITEHILGNLHKTVEERLRGRLVSGLGAAERVGALIGQVRRATMIVDDGVPTAFVERVSKSLRARELTKFTIRGGEGAKTLSQWAGLLSLLDGADRTTPLVAVGGGATTDVAGFAAATYMRGIPWIAVPTTLIGMVDAAIGGKTGINLATGKNLAGAFHQPLATFIDPSALETLPERELASGWGEIAKYALISRDGLWATVSHALASREFGTPDRNTIVACASFKYAIVREDPFEKLGRRKILNFGHTIGHAIEAASGFGPILHGEAVVLGMRGAVWLSREKKLLDPSEAQEILDLLARYPAPAVPSAVTDDAIMERLTHDKKNRDGKLLFVLLRKRGDPVIDVEVSADEARAAIRFVRGDAGR